MLILKYTKQIFLFILFIISIQPIFPQNGGVKISGIVKDSETGEPIIGVNILVQKDSLNGDIIPFTGTATNSNGEYTTPKLPKGKYVVIFRNIGYKEQREKINITIISGTILLDVKLTPDAVELEEVVIRDEKLQEDNISVINVSPKLLSLLPSLSGEIDIFRSLTLLPGVKVASEMSSGIYVRGGSPDQNLTLVDGAMVYNPSHLGNIASTFNTYALYDVKLIKGAFPAEYGGRLSSVLDVKLREGTNEREKGIIGIGTIMSHATLEGPITEKLTYIISSRIMYYDKLQEMFQENSVTPRYNFFDINTKVNYKFSANENAALNIMYSKDNVYSPPVNLGFNYKTSWSNTNISTNWITMISESFILNSNLAYINYNFTSSLDDISSDSLANDYFSSSDLQDIAFKENLEFNISDSYTLKTGFEFISHNYELVNWILYDPILETSPDHSEQYLSYEFSIYLQNEWQPFAFLSTNLGVRFYKFSNSEKPEIEPRLSLSFSLTENIFIKAAYAEAHQFLHLILRNDIRLPTDLWYPSTRKIQPSQSNQAVAGIEFYSNDKVYLFSVEAYYKEMKNIYEFRDMPEYSLNTRIEEHFTKGEGEAYGFEFFLNKRSGSFSGWIGYTISWTERLFPTLNAGRIFPPRYDRLYDVSLVLTYEIFQNFNFGLTWTYSTGSGLTMPTAKYYYTNSELDGNEKQHINYSTRNEYKLPDYHKLDINFNYSTILFSAPVNFYINLYNAYDRKNAFAQYISYDFDVENNTFDYSSDPKLRQITLMPFFPTFGFSIKF